MTFRTQIKIIFIASIVVAIGISSFLYYRTAREGLLQQVYNKVEAVSESKKQRIMSFIKKRQEQIMLIQVRDIFTREFVDVLQNRDEQKISAIRKKLQETRDKIPSYKEFFLVSLDGEVVISSDYRYEGSDINHMVSFQHALKGEICMHDIFYNFNDELSHNVSGLLTYEGDAIGVIVITITADRLLEIIQDYTGLGETGETVIARKLPSGEIYYIAPTRFYPIHSDSITSPTNPRYAMAHALSGREGLMKQGYIDYREEPIISSSRYIHDTGWGLITKIDQKEAMAPIRTLLWQTLMVAFLLILLMSFLAYHFTNKLTRPIRMLTKTSKQIANGQLDKRIKYHKKNEFGYLAFNFNAMADKLVESNKSLRLKIEELNRVNDSLNQFAHVVSHDLKSPLSSVIGLLDLVRRNLSNGDTEKMLEMAQERANHMNEMIYGILNSSSGYTDDQQEVVDLNELIQEILRHVDVPEHITIVVDDLPSLHIEKVLIQQVFQNLISNAIKYMDKPEGKVRIGSVSRDGEHVFFIEDNGRGIEKRHFGKIFNVFNNTRRIEGVESTGLGLSIVKRIIENKGGKIWVESEVGKGSIFFFTLPHEVRTFEKEYRQNELGVKK
jgi:signal transduction histidine kinase